MNTMTKSESPTNRYRLITRRIDENKIRHKSRRELEVHTSIVKNVKINGDVGVRSGAIIYTHQGGKTYFCLGIDSEYGDLTDFAGGVKKEENVIEGGLRELEEESQGIFGELEYEDVKNCLTFYTNNMMTMFIRLDLDMKDCKKKFNRSIKKKQGWISVDREEIEVSDIIWLDTQEFLLCINGRGKTLYSRVKRILSKVTEIIQAL